ncbi:bifunctional DNA-formamidopyrimidine glycosylase/DNA-(apurinic or apyrimidinic site) lyase [Rhodoferax aquaticus]|uniref:Formamidopyrimidine-DNA glycosylase n=1 Tax=Rhodoferax aquaticus TaxID=2527691 RepID=A0A515ELL2_9BURK|nr:bifunctional DNA-formamidopyrimidine glycosylase/DNA-(apurinic or apyrimidinic site) lyase [Rhodoferax aquaticus]QDL53560.1 bifunctional DNA-formamidopyrimidine glycosylase/DNA-(apurinic or apyrimidinic site) lyase [Rhodoferax aquaticus]
MPELPEVEVTRLTLVAGIRGAKVQALYLGKPLRWPLNCPTDDLIGRRILGVRRRGKYLLFDLEHGLLLVHLGMSGSLSFATTLPARGPHDHFELLTDQGTLRLHDPRRFGAVVYADAESAPIAQKLLGKLGMEPLGDGFLSSDFVGGLKRRNSPIKQVLLAGDLVVGVGNIYASEVLFMAGIRPSTKASTLSRPKVLRLHHAIQQVLARAVELGGTTLKDFSNAHGDLGHFQHETMVYGRQGLPCKVCNSEVRMIRQGQRSTYFCPTCQKR